MKLETLTSQDWLNHELLPFVVIILFAAILAFVNRRKLGHHWQEWSTHHRLNRIGIKQVSNLKFPDGLGSSFKIDRLVLLHDSILLISFKPFSGNIYCADNISEWTQIIGQKSFKFENPLFDLEYQLNAIRAHAPDVPIRGYLFFDHSASFPKGHPEQVLHPANIPEYLFRVNRPDVDNTVLKAWDNLLEVPKHLLQSSSY